MTIWVIESIFYKVNAIETMKVIGGLSEEQRRKVLELKAHIEMLESKLEAILRQSEAVASDVDLSAREINQNQAADLKARLNTFSEDWDRPEMAVYDQAPAR